VVILVPPAVTVDDVLALPDTQSAVATPSKSVEVAPYVAYQFIPKVTLPIIDGAVDIRANPHAATSDVLVRRKVFFMGSKL
jgi:hypothetical protein